MCWCAAIGKLLLYGLMFGVLDPVLTVACRAAHKSPFQLPSDPALREKADKMKASLAQEVNSPLRMMNSPLR